jgi:hypothetical protein
MSTEIRNIHQRMNDVMKDVGYIQKTDKGTSKGLQYNFASHDQVTGALHAPFVEHGILCLADPITFRQDGNRTEMEVLVSYINIDNPDDKVQVKSWGYGIDGQDKGPGKAISYATKMAHLKTFMLETGNDPEKDDIDHVPAEKIISKEELAILLDKIKDAKENVSDFNEKVLVAHFDCKDYSKINTTTYNLVIKYLDGKLLRKSKVANFVTDSSKEA